MGKTLSMGEDMYPHVTGLTYTQLEAVIDHVFTVFFRQAYETWNRRHRDGEIQMTCESRAADLRYIL